MTKQHPFVKSIHSDSHSTKVTITDKERIVLQAIVNSNFQDGGDPVDNWVWSFSVTDACPLPATSMGGVLTSLFNKGLAKGDGQVDRDACIAITAKGMEALNG